MGGSGGVSENMGGRDVNYMNQMLNVSQPNSSINFNVDQVSYFNNNLHRNSILPTPFMSNNTTTSTTNNNASNNCSITNNNTAIAQNSGFYDMSQYTKGAFFLPQKSVNSQQSDSGQYMTGVPSLQRLFPQSSDTISNSFNIGNLPQLAVNNINPSMLPTTTTATGLSNNTNNNHDSNNSNLSSMNLPTLGPGSSGGQFIQLPGQPFLFYCPNNPSV
jgi:hypothetical protein